MMSEFKRFIDLTSRVKHKSLFLLGPRQTGKSTLLRELFPHALYIDLLAADVFRELSGYPESLRQRLKEHHKLIIIDEVQKLPILLDEVQLLIDRHPDIRFILTGSSARKLKRGHANLLGGRALMLHLYPLVYSETGNSWLQQRLSVGSLPAILKSEIAWEELKAYVGTYLREEIQAESLTRQLDRFARFLDFCAHLNGQQVNYTKIGNDAGISPRTVRDYVQVLIDTMIVSTLSPFNGAKRKAVATEKLYFFDVGVANYLLGKRSVVPKTPDFGQTLEHLIYLELKAYLDYHRLDQPLNYWRTASQIEIDFLVGGSIAVEVKGSGRIASQNLKSMHMLREETSLQRQIIVCDEPLARTVDHVEIMPWRVFLENLWDGKIIY